VTARRITEVVGAAAVVLAHDLDTDQIVPARFLKVTDKAGLGDALFADYRRGFPGGFPLDRPAARGAVVLVVGRNFGCGSSREHAPWALLAAGLRAVVALSFADIFRANALKNGLLPVALGDADHAALVAALGAGSPPVHIDLAAQSLACGEVRASFAIDPFARRCLLEGLDELGYLLAHLPQIEAHERAAAEAAP
jgi:3-isopropylmalate/(R)-2-methylmalate dehydratase small subunit